MFDRSWPCQISEDLFSKFLQERSEQLRRAVFCTLPWCFVVFSLCFCLVTSWRIKLGCNLGGGFKDFLFSPLLGEDFPFWLIFFKGVVQPPTSNVHYDSCPTYFLSTALHVSIPHNLGSSMKINLRIHVIWLPTGEVAKYPISTDRSSLNIPKILSLKPIIYL